MWDVGSMSISIYCKHKIYILNVCVFGVVGGIFFLFVCK